MDKDGACSLYRLQTAATAGLLLSASIGAAFAHDPMHADTFEIPPEWIHENGVGPDPDGDGNPATDAFAFLHIGDPDLAAKDPIYKVITFEPPPGGHGEIILKAYGKEYGVEFGAGLTQQICKGQRYFRYDSACTYIAPPSGDHAALYRDDFYRPLTITFRKPVCAVATALYPTGGKDGEVFETVIQAYDENGAALEKYTSRFEWAADTMRWRMMNAVRFDGANVKRIEFDLISVKDKNRIVRFLIDDFSFADENCIAGS